MTLLQEEAELAGNRAAGGYGRPCPPGDRLKLETARSIREDFLHQNAFHEVDTYTSLEKQYLMMTADSGYYDAARQSAGKGRWISE